MSDEDNKTDHVDNGKSLDAANVAVFRKVRKLGKVKLVVLAFLAAIVVAVGIAAYMQSLPVLKVGKYSYNKDEYKLLVAQAAKLRVGEADARKALTKNLASKEAADRQKVSYPTDAVSLNEAARYEYGLKTDDTSKITDYQRETAVHRIVEANVRLETKGGYKASVVYLPFARYIYGFDANSKTAENANFDLIGDPDAIARDMGYAYKKAEELRGAYESKKKTSAQVVQASIDEKVSSYGKGSRPTSNILVTRDQQLQSYEETGTPRYLQQDQFNLIQASKDKLGKASGIVEELVSPEGVTSSPVIMRGNQVAVSYYFIIVDSVVEPRTDVQKQYDKLVKELQ